MKRIEKELFWNEDIKMSIKKLLFVGFVFILFILVSLVYVVLDV